MPLSFNPQEVVLRESPASGEVRCAHCQLLVPVALIRDEQEPSFCCSGCETVFGLLAGAGLEDYYTFRERLGEAGRPVPEQPGSESELDSPAFAELYCSELPGGLQKTQLLLEGVHCAACLWLVERLPRLEPAVVSARLEMSRSRVELVWDPEQAKLGQLGRTLTRMGYRPRPFRASAADELRRGELRSLLVRIGVAGASAGNVMLMAFALYSGAVGMDEADTMSAETRRFFEVASLFVSLPALWAGSLFFRGAWASLRTRTPHMDLPIALGIAVGFLWGASAALWGQGEIYFDSITALIFFLLIGRYLQRRHQMAVSDAAELLHAVLPGSVRILRPAIPGESERGVETVAVSQVLAGNEVLVESGEVVPVDGRVLEGHSSLDKSLLTGESRGVTVKTGDSVYAGALNLGARLVVFAEKAPAEARVAQLMQEVEQALHTRTPLVGRADRIAGVFTVSVLGLALAAGLLWSQVSVAAGVEHALALLIVACPCALGLATPLALSAGTRQAAEAGMLVFSPEALERLGAPATLVFDKTGTLTEGKLKVLSWVGDRSLGPFVLAVEKGATHPVARALVEFLEGDDERLRLTSVPSNLTDLMGRGRSADFGGKRLLVGAPVHVLSQATLPQELQTELEVGQGPASPVLVAWEREVRAIVWLGDAIRSDAVESLVKARRLGHRIQLLSGDHDKTAQAVAAELARRCGDSQLFASVRGSVTPEGKLAAMKTLQASGQLVVMVGDGVNDAAALAQADVGVAVSGAAEASRLSADVFLAQSGVARVVDLLEGARRVLSTIRRGMGFSLAYNGVGIACAAAGVLGPLEAAILMPLSSLTVVTNAYRSRSFRLPKGASVRKAPQ